MFRPIWPSSGVRFLVVQKLLCSFSRILVRPNLFAGVFVTGPLSMRYLYVTKNYNDRATTFVGEVSANVCG
jgi:hypothetical protein